MNEITVLEKENTLSVFQNENSFQNGMMMATQLAKSDLIPVQYKNKPENCVIALELANRLCLSPMMIMQNLYIIQGRPSWSSSFVISAINRKYKNTLRFLMNKDKTSCCAYIEDRETKERIYGTTVSMEMAKKEGWITKNGSKWLSFPEQMLKYRAAAFFGRLYCPEVLNGLLTVEEANDIASEEKCIDIFAEEVLPEDTTIEDVINQTEAINEK